MTTTATPLEDALLAEPIDVERAIALLGRAADDGAPPGLSLLARCFAHPSPELRAAAYASLRGARSLQALQTLLDGLDDASDTVVVAAAEAMLDTDDHAPQALVAFHSRAIARRVAARKAAHIDLVYLLLADDAARADAVDRLRDRVEDVLPLRQMLAGGAIPAADAARLFANAPDVLGQIVLQIAWSPMLFDILDRVPGAWLALLHHRKSEANADWIAMTLDAANHHAAASTWNAEALIVESTTMPGLLLDPRIPLDVRRAALRDAAGLTSKGFEWSPPFIARAFGDDVAFRDSGVHDLRAAYALLDVIAGGKPLATITRRLGKSAIVRAAPEGAADLAFIIGASKIGHSDHAVAEEWLEAIARAEPLAFVDITRGLHAGHWTTVVHAFGYAELEGLLGALADSDAPADLWSAWTAAITGSGPSITALLESRGFHIVRNIAVSAEQQSEAARLRVPATIVHTATGIAFILIPGGEYLMGGHADDAEAYPREKPARAVTVEPFYLAVSPITQEQWTRGGGTLAYRDSDAFPARGVPFVKAIEFLERVKCGMRLPTEAEWERAARAGTATRYWWGDDFRKGMVNCQGEFAKERPTPVGHFPPNPWGLLDILGNVYEWCQEWFEEKRWRVLRGGSWYHERWNARCSERFWAEPDGTEATGFCGVRPALDLSVCFDPATAPPSAPAA